MKERRKESLLQTPFSGGVKPARKGRLYGGEGVGGWKGVVKIVA